ncbi:hypothetical protein K443DRAFT_222842 [Laccaria amethystina LaAM-08-1]|uniref:Uncharacterized protein n=1 Tax=Laccaria amethystina LaAM-08-1 TaxID=1095629 RepID=A0A0C9WMC4_9AGAR|nr:hypothetical protein K443DRAFT_222842 [Laccaria amethystina LaAM-08-1]
MQLLLLSNIIAQINFLDSSCSKGRVWNFGTLSKIRIGSSNRFKKNLAIVQSPLPVACRPSLCKLHIGASNFTTNWISACYSQSTSFFNTHFSDTRMRKEFLECVILTLISIQRRPGRKLTIRNLYPGMKMNYFSRSVRRLE